MSENNCCQFVLDLSQTFYFYVFLELLLFAESGVIVNISMQKENDIIVKDMPASDAENLNLCMLGK